jgi:hypothetical protein
MEAWLLPAGLGVSVAGAVVLALADAWLSRSILVYLDAIEADVHRLAVSVRGGSTECRVIGIDLPRDRRQNRARAMKMFGWLILAVGLALQFGASYPAVAPSTSAAVAARP